MLTQKKLELLELVNSYCEYQTEEPNAQLIENIKFKPLYYDIITKNIENFSDFLKIEEDFLIEQIDK